MRAGRRSPNSAIPLRPKWLPGRNGPLRRWSRNVSRLYSVIVVRNWSPRSAKRARNSVNGRVTDKSPDWSYELAYQRRDPAFGDMVMAQVTVSLPLFGSTRQDPIISARSQTASRVRIDREVARRAAVAELEADLADHVMHHDRLTRADTTLVPLADQRARLETASYAAGNASLSDVLDALLGLAEARIDRLDREADVVRDGVRIFLTYGSDPA